VIAMLDKVQYWLDLADDDVKAANLLLKGGSYLQAGFFCHLIAEKALKAVIAHNTDETPPKIHKLKELAVKGIIFDDLSEEQIALLTS
jgi:HEPN domain-containing protein